MANQKQALTAANIKYLLALYSLDPSGQGIRSVRLAEFLDITKPSVHTMIGTLKDRKLVRKDIYGTVSFTEEGKSLAQKYSEYYDVVCDYLDALLSDESDIKAATCALLAEIPENSLAVMYKKQLIKETIDNVS
ncbi:MAG TPA: hypothetical protein GX401_10000 [Clostridiales bacterium]|nr:hypothetical protein [Clostridiales bacterium]